MKPIVVTREWFERVVRAAALDAGDKSMRKAGQKSWNVEDYNVAVKEFGRLTECKALKKQDEK